MLKDLDYKKHRRSQVDSIDKRLVQLQKELDGIEQIKLGLYTDLKQGIITQEDYISLKMGYGQKTVTLTEQIAQLKEARQTLDHKESLQNELITRFRQYGQIDTLTRSIVTELIARIDVHEGRAITIHFKFEDEFEKVKAFAEQEMQELQAAV